MAADGNSFIIGAYSDNDNGNSSGSAYVYKWNGSIWHETKILASDGEAGDYFGQKVAIASAENGFVVSSIKDDDNGFDAGAVYVYE